MNKIRLFLFCTLMLNNLMLNKMLSAANFNLNGTTGTSIYVDTQYTFTGNYAKGFVCLNAGFNVLANAYVSLGVLQPVSGNINLNGNGAIVLTGDLTLGSNIVIQNGGVIYGQDNTIFLNGDLTIPAGMGFYIASNTTIDGQGHDIIFEDGAYLWIDGPAGTTLTLRNCVLHGFTNYSGVYSGYGSIGFGSNANQKLVLNEVVLHLAGDYNFSGGLLDIQNFVNITGTTYNFIYNSEYEYTIKSDATLVIDNRTLFTHEPIITGQAPAPNTTAQLLVMEDKSSKLFLNGCTLSLPLSQGLVLTNGNLLVDHKTNVYGNGAVNGLALGNSCSENDLLIDIMPGATFEIQETTLHYNNLN